jgi:hypothetical protein
VTEDHKSVFLLYGAPAKAPIEAGSLHDRICRTGPGAVAYLVFLYWLGDIPNFDLKASQKYVPEE